MNKKTQQDLERAAELLTNISQGIEVQLTAKDLKLLPECFGVMSPTAAKRKGFKLKRNAKRIGTIEWKIPGAGYGHGDMYLGNSFVIIPGKIPL